MADVIESKLLPGVRQYTLNILPDERGSFTEIFRNDWKELFGEDQLLQANLSISYPGIVRAWHRHNRGQVDYFLVIQGAVKICAYDDRPGLATNGKLVEIIASAAKPQLVRIPGYYWHGSKNVADMPSVLVYFVNRLYDYQSPDEERRPWNDPAIVDTRYGQPFDWNRCPNK